MNLIKEAAKVRCHDCSFLVVYCAYRVDVCPVVQAHKWKLDLGEIARIWKGGCIIRAKFLNRIKVTAFAFCFWLAFTFFSQSAYDRDSTLANLLIDTEFAKEINARQSSLRKIITVSELCFFQFRSSFQCFFSVDLQMAITSGICVPSFSARFVCSFVQALLVTL
jgi:6-phosphogluconate dehydrogenase